MALEKIEVIDSMNVLEDGQIQVRQATKIMEDGKEISKTYHRWVLSPGQDLTDQEDKVKKIAEAVWTTEVKDKYKTEMDKLKLNNA